MNSLSYNIIVAGARSLASLEVLTLKQCLVIQYGLTLLMLAFFRRSYSSVSKVFAGRVSFLVAACVLSWSATTIFLFLVTGVVFFWLKGEG